MIKLSNLTEARTYEVADRVKDNLEEENISINRHDLCEALQAAPFRYYKRVKKVNSLWVRLSIFLLPVAFVALLIGVIVKWFGTGIWGYKYDRIQWYYKWTDALGF